MSKGEAIYTAWMFVLVDSSGVASYTKVGDNKAANSKGIINFENIQADKKEIANKRFSDFERVTKGMCEKESCCESESKKGG